MRTIWVSIILIMQLWGNSTTLERNGWNLISVCQDMDMNEVNMSNIQEIQNQEGKSIYTGEWAEYSNLKNLEAGYGYWVKGDAGAIFDGGEANTTLKKPLKRTGWNLMASCEDVDKADINMTAINEIQAQDGHSLYTGDNAQHSNLDRLLNGYGYWVKGSKGTLFQARGNLDVSNGNNNDNNCSTLIPISDDSNFSDTPPNDNIAYSEQGETVKDIEKAFNNARSNDATISKPLVMPSQEKWDSMSIQEKALFLLNSERYDRGIKPFEGINTDVANVAQNYAEFLYANGKFGHNEDGTPWERLDRISEIKNNKDFFSYAENIYASAGSNDFTKNPIVKAIYNWIYKDKGSSWGHRKFCLAHGLKDNSGENGREGLIGFGLKKGEDYAVYPDFKSTIVVFNAFDPASSWNHDSTIKLPCSENNSTTQVVHDNFALLYGKATQGSAYNSSYPASNVLDDNNDTFNHTLNNSSTNWLQVELPEGLEVREIVVINRNSVMSRLNGAKVYLNSQSYSGILSEDNLVGTLTSDLEQKINLNPAKVGNFVLIKANGSNYLHVAEVKVYGSFGDKPYIVNKNATFGLDFNATVGAFVGKIEANVKVGKSLNYSLVGDVPFSIDSNGILTLNGALNYNSVQSYNFKVNVSSNEQTSEANVTVKLLSTHGVKAWRWSGISGGSINSFLDSSHYKNDLPDSSFFLDKFDFNENREDNFGQKMSAVLKVPKSGLYTFAIIGDDGTRLDFNGIENFAHKSYWGHYQDWDSAGKSRKIYLQKGEVYPLSVYLKEGGGLEGLSVGWKMQNEDSFSVIPSEYLYKEELNSTNVQPVFKNDISEFTVLKSENSIGDIVLNLGAYDSQDELTYSIVGDVPFSIDEDGNIVISGSLEVKDYEFDVKVTDGVNEAIHHITIHSPVNTKGLNEAKEAFYDKARAFDGNQSVDELVNSFLAYSHKKAQNDYDLYITEALDSSVWQFIEDNPSIKEGLYASRFPVDPYSIKNLGDFLAKWKEDGKDDAFIQKYKNVALGLAINAKERGIFKQAIFGDTADHRVIDYLTVPKLESKKRRWLEYFDFKNLGYSIGYYKFANLVAVKYKLTTSEKNSLWSASAKLRQAINDGYSADTITPDVRQTYNISYDELNLFKVLSSQERVDCSADGNPCAKIATFIANENNETLTKSYILAHFSDYKSKIGLISARDDMADELAGELGVLPHDQKAYRLMPFYDLANWKIANDQIAPVDFNDSEPNWPIFNVGLSQLPWQVLALEQGAQKKECEYVKDRFFETDKSNLEASYPPHAIDGGKKKDKRFIQYTTYTWDYNRPEVWYRESEFTPHRSVYRILQDGGVCGRQSTMGQHVNECLSRPSIGTGQPGHRAWVGVYLNKNNPQQFQTDIGYQVGSRESATPHSYTIYNQYTTAIREAGLEKFTGVVTGVSPASVGEHTYNQSMILQHIAKLLEKEDSTNVEAVLKKAVDLAPQNVDAWYQLALYYAKLDKPEKIITLANDYMQKRDSFFMEPDNRKGAENLEVVTGKNIAFAINKAPSINDGKGERADWGVQQLKNYLDTYEADKRSTRSYRDLNRYFANLYLAKEKDTSSFENAVENLFDRFLNNTSTGRYDDYFSHVNFTDINKTELFDILQEMTDSAQISDKKRSNIYSKILGRDLTKALAELNVNDICLDNNLSKCQSVQDFTLNAKAIYMIVDNKIGDDKEVNPTNRGKEGYSRLTVATVDDLGKDKDIIVRIAKVGAGGKLLKINDPSEVEGDKTKIVAWITSDDNSLEENRIYTARQRIILHVKKRVSNNEESMGSVVLNVKNLMQGASKVINKESYTGETIKDDSTSIYFVALQSSVGSTKGVWWQEGYSTLSVPVVDNSGNKFTMYFRAYNNQNYKMNTGLVANWDNTLSIKYFTEDNPNLVSGNEYKSIKPFTIDAKKWHKNGDTKKRYYFSVDITIP